MSFKLKDLPDKRGYFGDDGGRFVPETLVAPLDELEAAFLATILHRLPLLCPGCVRREACRRAAPRARHARHASGRWFP